MKQVHGTKELDIAYLLLENSGCVITILFKGLQNRGQSFEVFIHFLFGPVS